MELRARKSSLLGFGTHADFVLEMNMAKSAKRVAAFLGEQAAVCRWSFPLRLDAFPSLSSEELYRKLKPLGDDERSLILKLKEEECRKRALPFDGQLRAWDTRYFMTQVTQRPPVAAAASNFTIAAFGFLFPRRSLSVFLCRAKSPRDVGNGRLANTPPRFAFPPVDWVSLTPTVGPFGAAAAGGGEPLRGGPEPPEGVLPHGRGDPGPPGHLPGAAGPEL